MDEGFARGRPAGRHNAARRSGAQSAPPDRLALWAVFLCLIALVAGAASAKASSGGVPTPGSEPAAPAGGSFGSRVLSEGMQGSDVKVLNGIIKSKPYGGSVRLNTLFNGPTLSAVKQFQTDAGLSDTGVVNRSTSRALVRSMPKAVSTWYDLAGNHTACGQTLTHATIGVAHKTLPCGTRVTFAYHGHYVIAPVIDRGPFARGRTWDLTRAAAEQLGLTSAGVDDVRYSVAHAGSDARLP